MGFAETPRDKDRSSSDVEAAGVVSGDVSDERGPQWMKMSCLGGLVLVAGTALA